MGKKIYKSYKEYICPRCKKNFGNYKYHYEVHLNKKKPCNLHFDENNIDVFDDSINSNDINDINNNCSNKNDYNKNVNSDLNNKNTNNDLNNTDKNFINNINNEEFMVNFYNKMELLLKQNDELMKKSDEILKQNDEFKEDIKYLKEENDKIKKQLIISNKKNKSNKIITNTNINIDEANINLNVQINNFNDMDYSKINIKNLIKTLIKEQGKQIFLKTIQDIFVNPEKPENHNIYIADKNRKYLKTYNNNKWNTEDFKIIDKLIEKIVGVYRLSIEEIKKDVKLYERIKKSIHDKLKYLNYCDLEYLAELEDEQDNGDNANKDEIKRSKDFYEMVHNDIVNLLHDNKNIILNTHKSIIV